MAAYRRVYDSRHLQADCQEPGSAPEPYARESSMGYFYLFYRAVTDIYNTLPLFNQLVAFLSRDRELRPMTLTFEYDPNRTKIKAEFRRAQISTGENPHISKKQFLPLLGNRITRSSAIAEGPRDASYQLKSCQLPKANKVRERILATHLKIHCCAGQRDPARLFILFTMTSYIVVHYKK